MFSCHRESGQFASAHPIIVFDLDGNGFSEIIVSRWNRVYWNDGKRYIPARDGCLSIGSRLRKLGSSVMSPVTASSILFAVSSAGELVVFEGESQGRFSKPPRIAASPKFQSRACHDRR